MANMQLVTFHSCYLLRLADVLAIELLARVSVLGLPLLPPVLMFAVSASFFLFSSFFKKEMAMVATSTQTHRKAEVFVATTSGNWWQVCHQNHASAYH